MANLSENLLEKLPKILASENNGNINYLPFLIHVRTVCSILNAKKRKEDNFENFDSNENSFFGSRTLSGVQKNVPGIIEQLLVNGVDKDGMLFSIRKWILTNTSNKFWLKNRNKCSNENSSNILEISVKEFIDLLKEFNILFSTNQVIEIIHEFGLYTSTQEPRFNNQNNQNNKSNHERSKYANNKYENNENNMNNIDKSNSYYYENGLTSSQISESGNHNLGEFSQFNGKAFDARLLINKLIEVRTHFFTL